MSINMKEWIKSVVESKERIAIPIMTHPGIEMCGYTVRQAVTDGGIHAKAIKKLEELYPAAATSVIMDLTVEAEAFGAQVLFEDDAIPTVTGRLVSDLESIKKLDVPGTNSGRIPEYLKANRLSAEQIVGKPVLAGCIGPFSLAGRLFDLSEMLMYMYIEPDTIHLLLKKCSALILNYVKAIKETGANGVIMAEPAAGLVSNEDCISFSSDYIKPIVDEVQNDDFIVVLHNCGNTGHCTDAMVRTGAAAFHFGNRIDMIEAIDACPCEALVMGNLDPVGVFKMSEADAVYDSTMELLEKTKAYPNFVLSSGCDIPPQVPQKNIKAFYKALEDFNRHR